MSDEFWDLTEGESSQEKTREKSTLGRGNSKCKGRGVSGLRTERKASEIRGV
jgi:hypothetical protein